MVGTEKLCETTRKANVIALHCSGAGGYQWRRLAQVLGDDFNVTAPDLIGCGAAPHWTGERPFTASEEAAQAIVAIDAAQAPVHLIGHSYGGSIALRAARERPARIASLTLYEPMSLHVLKTAGEEGYLAFKGMMAFARELEHLLLRGATQAAAEIFVDRFNGAGAWAAMSEDACAQIIRYAPKAPLEFRAVSNEYTPLAAYRRFNFPVLLMVGEHAAEPERLIGRQLFRAMRFASLRTVLGAGHMAPFTHHQRVNEMIADHIARASPRADRPARSANQPLAA